MIVQSSTDSRARSPGPRRSGKAAWIVVGALFLLTGGSLLEYTRRTFADAVFMDGMQLLPTVGDFFSGRLTPAKLFIPYGEHRIALYRLIMIASSSLLGLNMYVDPILSTCASLATAAILYVAFEKTVKVALSPLAIALAFIPMVAICGSLAYPPTMFMSTQFHLSTILVLLTGLLVWGGQVETSGRRLAIVTGLIVVYFVLFSGGYFPGLLASIAAVIVFRLVVERKAPSRGEWMLAVLAVACAGIYARTIVHTGAFAKPLSEKIALFFREPGVTLRFFLAGFASSVVDIHSFMDRLPSAYMSTAVFSVGAIVLLFSAIALRSFLRSRMWMQTYLPAWLLAYPIGIMAAVRLGRIDGGWSWMMNEWYAFHLKFIPLAIFWVLLFATVARGRAALAAPAPATGGVDESGARTANLEREGPSTTRVRFRASAASVTLTAFVAFLASTWLWTNWNQWLRTRHVRAWYEERRQALLAARLDDDSIEKVLLVSREEGRTGLAILAKYHLNAFREDDRVGARVGSGSAPRSVGRTLACAHKSTGWHDDGWIRPQALMTMRCGPRGVLRFSGYLPEDVFRRVYGMDVNVDLLVNGTIVGSRKVTAESFGDGRIAIEASVPQAGVVPLEIRVSKSFIPADHPEFPRDGRELAMKVIEVVCD